MNETVEDTSKLQLSYTKDSIFRKLGINSDWAYLKTCQCSHECGCIENVLKDSLKSFSYGMSIKVVINSLLFLINITRKRTTLASLIKIFINKDNFKLAGFLGLMTFLMKGVLCALRAVRGRKDGLNEFISGVVAGYFSLFLVNKKNRSFYATFFLTRGIECFYNSLVNSGKIKKSRFHFAMLFVALNMVTVNWYCGETYLVTSSLKRFYDFVYMMDFREAECMDCLKEVGYRAINGMYMFPDGKRLYKVF